MRSDHSSVSDIRTILAEFIRVKLEISHLRSLIRTKDTHSGLMFLHMRGYSDFFQTKMSKEGSLLDVLVRMKAALHMSRTQIRRMEEIRFDISLDHLVILYKEALVQSCGGHTLFEGDLADRIGRARQKQLKKAIVASSKIV